MSKSNQNSPRPVPSRLPPATAAAVRRFFVPDEGDDTSVSTTGIVDAGPDPTSRILSSSSGSFSSESDSESDSDSDSDSLSGSSSGSSSSSDSESEDEIPANGEPPVEEPPSPEDVKVPVEELAQKPESAQQLVPNGVERMEEDGELDEDDDDEVMDENSCEVKLEPGSAVLAEPVPEGGEGESKAPPEKAQDGSATFGKVVEYTAKYSLLEKGRNEFEFLPKGWIVVVHNSGMPLYLHQETRVCTWSQPYSIGPGSVRRHDVPLSAIPCLKYLRELEKENFATKPGIVDAGNGKNGTEVAVEPTPAPVQQEGSPRQCPFAAKENSQLVEPPKKPSEDGEIMEEGEIDEVSKQKSGEGKKTEEKIAEKPAEEQQPEEKSVEENGKRIQIQNAQLITAEERVKSELIDAAALREYCIRRFTISKRNVAMFDSWKSRRVFKRSANREMNRPQVPKNAKLITLPILAPGLNRKDGEGDAKADGDGGGPNARRHRIFNPAGKSYVSILHEVLFFSQQSYPDYKYAELTDASTPYAATVVIQGVEYGTGYGSSKRLAKVNAAKATLAILLPDCKKELKIEDDDPSSGAKPEEQNGVAEEENLDKAFFDTIDIEDPRVAKMSNTLGQPPPFQILTTCIQRNHGLGAFNVETDLIKHPSRKHIMYVMKVASHEVSVKCKNKREGKQLASQMILKKLHPLLGNWGALLRLYGVSPSEAAKKKHKLAQEVTKLQQKQSGEAKGRSMNHALLRKLREEMSKLKDSRANPQPIQPFVLPDDVSLPTSAECGLDAREEPLQENNEFEPLSSDSETERSYTPPPRPAPVEKEKLEKRKENFSSSSSASSTSSLSSSSCAPPLESRKRPRLELNGRPDQVGDGKRWN